MSVIPIFFVKKTNHCSMCFFRFQQNPKKKKKYFTG